MTGIQAAVNELPLAGGTVYISSGIIQVDRAVQLRGGVSVEGVGQPVFTRASTALDVNVFNTAGRGLSQVRLLGLAFDNASLATAAVDILISGGAADIHIGDCEWVHLASRASSLVTVQATGSGPPSRLIDISGNTVVGGTTTSTFNSFQVFDASDVTVSDNRIDGWGAIKVETSSAFVSAPARHISICRNTFHNVDQSNIFVRTNGASSIEQVDVSHNKGSQSGMTVLKGMINIGEAVSPGGSTSHVTCTGNQGRGFQKYFLNFGGGDGGGVVQDISVIANSFDGRLEDSTALRGTSESALVSLQNVDRCTVMGNTARYTGRSGIRGSILSGVIARNTLEFCAQNNTVSPGPERESAIYLTFPSSANVIAENVIRDSHSALGSTPVTSGITLDRGGVIKGTLIYGNTIEDDRDRSAGMKWGIKIGLPGNGPEPTDTFTSGNLVQGALTGESVDYTRPKDGGAQSSHVGTSRATHHESQDSLVAFVSLEFMLGTNVSRDTAVRLPGSRLGDRVTVVSSQSLARAPIVFYGWVSAPDTVTVRASRTQLGYAPIAGRFRLTLHP